MKKIFGLLSCFIVLGIGCTKTSINEEQNEAMPAVTTQLTHRG